MKLDVREEGGDIGALDGGIVEVVEVVEDRNGVADGEAFFDEMGADKAGSAGHENIHPRTLSAREKREQEKVPTDRCER